ncbi:MAG: DUF4105 domain-containing protein, partial [Myxococcales bacterium]|nr:DUF4105 domain-containing protein [Myxococcales bacterium]
MARALALLLLLTGLARAENPPPAPAIDLVIIGVTDDLYSLYGHTALLVRTDPKAPIENAELFNFGVTSFSGKHYIRDFITGRVESWGDERPWGRQLEAWKKHDRTVTRYPVQLSDDARRRLVARLRLAISPAYTRYIYDTFRENCATRPRDLLDEFSGGAVFAISGEAPSGLSYRDDVRIAFANLPGVLLATEIFPGPDLDRPRTRWEMSYRPEYLEQVMREVRLADGTPLLGEAIVEHQRRGPDPRD